MTIQNSTDDRPREEGPVELTPTEARQGVRGRPVLVVLVAGLVLAMLVWAAVELWGVSIAPRDTAIDAATTSSTPKSTEKATESPPAGDERQTEPVLIDPNPTRNQ